MRFHFHKWEHEHTELLINRHWGLEYGMVDSKIAAIKKITKCKKCGKRIEKNDMFKVDEIIEVN